MQIDSFHHEFWDEHLGISFCWRGSCKKSRWTSFLGHAVIEGMAMIFHNQEFFVFQIFFRESFITHRAVNIWGDVTQYLLASFLFADFMSYSSFYAHSISIFSSLFLDVVLWHLLNFDQRFSCKTASKAITVTYRFFPNFSPRPQGVFQIEIQHCHFTPLINGPP